MPEQKIFGKRGDERKHEVTGKKGGKDGSRETKRREGEKGGGMSQRIHLQKTISRETKPRIKRESRRKKVLIKDEIRKRKIRFGAWPKKKKRRKRGENPQREGKSLIKLKKTKKKDVASKRVGVCP